MDAAMILNEKLKIIDDIIAMEKMILDGHSVARITPAERMAAYDSVYTLCTQKSRDCSSLVYEKYTDCLRDRIQEKVLPMLMGMHGTELLTVVVQLWSEYKEFTSFLSKIFIYLDKFYIPRKGLPSLTDSPRCFFCNLVCDKLYSKWLEAMMRLIVQERAGEQEIDRSLLKNVFDFFLEVGSKGTTNYYEKFEQIMLAEVAAYYSQLSLEWWFWRDSFPNYLRKVDWCLNQEEGRAEIYPRQSTKTKIMDVMKYILLDRNAKKWAQHQKAEPLAAEDQIRGKCLTPSTVWMRHWHVTTTSEPF